VEPSKAIKKSPSLNEVLLSWLIHTKGPIAFSSVKLSNTEVPLQKALS